MTKLNDGVKAELEAPISLSEIDQAIDQLTAGKSPGPDNLETAFYKMFKSEIDIALHRLLVDAYKENRILLSLCGIRIILVSKTEDSVQLLSVTAPDYTPPY